MDPPFLILRMRQVVNPPEERPTRRWFMVARIAAGLKVDSAAEPDPEGAAINSRSE
jgi:hypothetical protein